MDLYVRSQDRMMLVKVNELAVCKVCNNYTIMVTTTDVQHQFMCGTYSTKEKALKVLDDIQKYLYSNCSTINELGFISDRDLSLGIVVYEMPIDEELKND